MAEALAAVQSQMTTINSYAATALAAADAALSTLASAGSAMTTIQPSQYGSPALPFYAPNLPSTPGALVVESAPDAVSIIIPTKVTKPDIASFTLGELFGITLPGVPTVSFPSIDIDAPVYSISAPEQWNFGIDTNILITDDPLIQAAIDRLTDNIRNGGTGLSADVEAAIWARELERSEQQLEDSTDKVITMWAKKGFSLPDGLLAHSLSEVQKEYMNRKIDRSREIAIKQADLEQSNLFKSLETAVNLADKLINMLIRYEELVFRCQDATAKHANEYIDLQIKTYMSLVEAYKATAQTYEMIIRAELAKVEVYKAQLEGQKLIGDVNDQTVKVYVAQIQATSMLIERYKTEVQAMVSELEVEKIKIEANKNQMDVWAKKADVAIAKYNGEIAKYKEDATINVSSAEIYNKHYEAQIRTSLMATEMSVRSTELYERNLVAKAQIMMEAARGVAQAAASMAAGAMAAASAQSSIRYDETLDLA